ncbi:hypothetical protein [Streptomyces subrutilus]|uniref:Uncharacterized protein n=1 Tax=Streptomyces subrutilus TaxID=36818 RepID=A0A1E5NXU6_9ACTN|nr:hypothetical protein [Streptomyces subrutilus]OEJ21035.1 hypothetical protein BGK67_34630 [Streptomyces subrutilus]
MSQNPDAAAQTTRIQGVGRVPAVQAQQLTPGDKVMWNGGHVVEVLAVEEASPCFLRVSLTSSTPGDSKPDVRRWKKTAIIGVPSARALTPDTTPQEPAQAQECGVCGDEGCTDNAASGGAYCVLCGYDHKSHRIRECATFATDVTAYEDQHVEKANTPDARATAPIIAPTPEPVAPTPAADFYGAIKASGLQLGDLVEYDGRIVHAPESPRLVPGGRGRLRDVWSSGGEIVGRVEREDGVTDAPALQSLRPAATTVLKASSELQKGDVVRDRGMRVRLDELNCPPYFAGTGEGLVYSWLGTVLNVHDVHADGHVPRSFLGRWEGSRLVRGDSWSAQGDETVQWPVEVPESGGPKSPPAPRSVTVTTATTRVSLPERLRAANAPGEMVTNDELGGVLRWRLPSGEELTPGEAAARFLS